MGSNDYTSTPAKTDAPTPETLTMGIQVDGRTIATFDAVVNEPQESVEKRAREIDAVKRAIEGKTVTVEFKANKVINFVTTQAPAA